VEATAQALQTIAEHMAGMPGRKNLIWVSGGFPVQIGMESTSVTAERRTFGDDIDRATRAVNSSNLAIYPVDARGLMGLFDTMPTMSAASPSMSRRAAANVNNRAAMNILETHATMRELAERTGGRAFLNNNDIAGAIRRAVDDSQVTYNLAFAPDHEQWNGRFRQIKIKVDRSGLEVRHRKGYVASAWPSADEKERAAEVNMAATSPLEATGLSLWVKRAASSPRLDLRLQVDPRNVDFEQKEGRWAAGLDVIVALRNDQGAVVRTFSRTAGFNLKPETFVAVLEKGLSLTLQCEVTPGATKARVVVRDTSNGQIGSVDVPIN
jgi:hypothetical protein